MHITSLTIYEIVKKINGPICPIGSSRDDEIRYNNLIEYISLIEYLLKDIQQIAQMNRADEFSKKKAATLANDLLRSISEM